jgi:hypothetical protein
LAKLQRAGNEEAWRNAKKLCRLSSRQVEMARALGMNPKKLPGLRPSPQQRWKLPVGAFIEECYRKRFGELRESKRSRQPERERRSPADGAREMASEAKSQVGDLVCYLLNLSDDLEKWLAHGAIPAEVLAQVREELREIADALGTGILIPQIPEIPIPPHPRRAPSVTRARSKTTFDDDELPF